MARVANLLIRSQQVADEITVLLQHRQASLSASSSSVAPPRGGSGRRPHSASVGGSMDSNAVVTGIIRSLAWSSVPLLALSLRGGLTKAVKVSTICLLVVSPSQGSLQGRKLLPRRNL